ncbi:hypothetical protein [Bartonella phoceensis]|uniref:hypothetical protein n=1 Tax=Bartonella phoceensis TaxID=270249 RepID=UPI001ABB57FA|nr:hypothetical protein [Bartonella phoceensis]
MDLVAMLLILLTTASIIVTSSMVSMCGIMTIVAVYYSFVKRIICACALSETFKKLKESAMQHFMRDEREEKEQKIAFDTKAYLSSFKESLSLSKNDYKRIFIFSLILFVFIFVPFAVSATAVGAEVIKGMDIKQLINNGSIASGVCILTFLLIFSMVVLVAFSLPVILVLYGVVNQMVKKKMKKWETFA